LARAALRCGSHPSSSAAACDRLLDVLQGELQLVGIELLGTAAEAGAPQLLQEMAQLPVLLDRPVTLGDGRVAFGDHAADQGAQRFDILGKGIGRPAHEAH
jgi:hypothetical protein